MATKIFVNLPVRDLRKTVAFFSKLDFKFNQQFTDENATCMIVGSDIFVMLLVDPVFKTFTNKEICDTKKQAEVILALSADSKQKVDEIADKAIRAGGKQSNEPQDQGFMYSRSFQDLDGHMWEVLYMDPRAIKE